MTSTQTNEELVDPIMSMVSLLLFPNWKLGRRKWNGPGKRIGPFFLLFLFIEEMVWKGTIKVKNMSEQSFVAIIPTSLERGALWSKGTPKNPLKRIAFVCHFEDPKQTTPHWLFMDSGLQHLALRFFILLCCLFQATAEDGSWKIATATLSRDKDGSSSVTTGSSSSHSLLSIYLSSFLRTN